jgi:hypothetical protein
MKINLETENQNVSKIENDTDDDWVWDFDNDKVINDYHTFVKKQRSAICIL